MGGGVEGSSNSNSTQGSSATFTPSAVLSLAGIPVSPDPVGQGLATVNSALPGSAAYNPASYFSIAQGTPAASSSSSLATWLVIGAAALAAWWLFHKGRR